MKKLSLLALLVSGCVVVVSPEEKPTPTSSKEQSTTLSKEQPATTSTKEEPTSTPTPTSATAPTTPGDVTFTAVSSRVTPGFIDDYELSVKIALEVNTKMPNVAPHIEVFAECEVGPDTYTSKEQAFFMSLSMAAPGNKKEDTVKLFGTQSLPQKPTRCDLTLQLTAGGGTPQRYCFQGEATRPGECSP